jgi:hypothetical protein
MGVAAAARLRFQEGAITGQRLFRVEQVQTFVGVAFHGQNTALRGEKLLKHGHLKHAPEQIAFQSGQFAVAGAREDDNRGGDGRQRNAACLGGLGQLVKHERRGGDCPGAAHAALDLPQLEIRREHRDPERRVVGWIVHARHPLI